MRINEIIIEEVTRRDFLKTLGAGALVAATGDVLAKGGGQHLPYEPDSDMGKDLEWKKLDAKKQASWSQRQKALVARANKVLTKIISVMPPKDQEYMRGVRIQVPLTYALYDIANSGKDKVIGIDLGTFWDLSDDCLGYCIGHELGHIYFNATGKHPFDRSWKTPELKKLKVQSELDCDTYGAKLAFAAGYSPTEAYKQFSEEDKKWRYDPNKQGYNYYPDQRMRDVNFKKTIDQEKAAKMPKPETPSQDTQVPDENKPRPDQQAMFGHIMRGISQLA